MSGVEVVAALVVAVVVIAAWVASMRMVAQVDEEFGADPALWQRLMLLFGIFGPVIARVLLSRNSGGRGGGFA
jgi:hypothetical protein